MEDSKDEAIDVYRNMPRWRQKMLRRFEEKCSKPSAKINSFLLSLIGWILSIGGLGILVGIGQSELDTVVGLKSLGPVLFFFGQSMVRAKAWSL